MLEPFHVITPDVLKLNPWALAVAVSPPVTAHDVTVLFVPFTFIVAVPELRVPLLIIGLVTVNVATKAGVTKTLPSPIAVLIPLA
jgi:hypothetical protein